jgi:hypothetical protein
MNTEKNEEKMDKIYKPHIQKLYEYFAHRVNEELHNINAERQEEKESKLNLSFDQIQEVSQELLNHIVDSDEFYEEVAKLIYKKAEVEYSTDN